MDQKTLIKLVDYNPKTGEFTWKNRSQEFFQTDHHMRSWNTRYAGKTIGVIDPKGYRSVFIMGKQYRLHRLAWLYCYGNLPKIVDHINGIKTDNRIENLREVTQQQNLMNAARSNKNTSGVTGVYFNQNRGIWCAQIKFNGQTYHLGSSKNFEKAVELRKNEEKRLGFSKRHGAPKC